MSEREPAKWPVFALGFIVAVAITAFILTRGRESAPVGGPIRMGGNPGVVPSAQPMPSSFRIPAPR